MKIPMSDPNTSQVFILGFAVIIQKIITANTNGYNILSLLIVMIFCLFFWGHHMMVMRLNSGFALRSRHSRLAREFYGMPEINPVSTHARQVP